MEEVISRLEAVLRKSFEILKMSARRGQQTCIDQERKFYTDSVSGLANKTVEERRFEISLRKDMEIAKG